MQNRTLGARLLQRWWKGGILGDEDLVYVGTGLQHVGDRAGAFDEELALLPAVDAPQQSAGTLDPRVPETGYYIRRGVQIGVY